MMLKQACSLLPLVLVVTLALAGCASLHLFATTSMGIFMATLARFRKTVTLMA